MKKRIMENGIEYVRCGNCYIPNLMVPECKHEIGKKGYGTALEQGKF